MNIGVIGLGYVGKACLSFFEKNFNCYSYDINNSGSEISIKKLVEKVDIIFLCLPTPMKQNGECDISIVENVLAQINQLNVKISCVIKSTIPPGTTKKWDNEYKFLNIVFSPEFLTEANAVSDFENQNRIILGGPRPATTELRRLYSKVFPKAHIIKTDSTHAEMVKYLTNSFLATKVSFANEIYQVCEKLNIDYDKVVEYATLDDRLGKSHWNVPGPDGDFGFGGHCLPKDLSALIYLAMNLDTETNVLNAVEETNDVVRKNRDWENMKGRAVV